MRRNPWLVLVGLFIVFVGLVAIMLGRFTFSLWGHSEPKVTAKNSILKLELEGVILDGKKFLKQLKKYRENDKIKAIVVEVNSPGGVVGPSQEIYQEILNTREDYEKPVVMVSTGLMASGAYYAAVAADQVIVSPGAMLGSIGVIMEFMNLEKLYEWAKISRYTINTGKYKDSGAEYRAMRPDEKELFQNLINDVYEQFKAAVAKGRNLKPEFVAEYADGRVFTGAQAVKMGFADDIGTVDDAYELAAELANIDEYEIFEVPKRHSGFLEMLQAQDDDETMRIPFSLPKGSMDSIVEAGMKKLFHSELANRPLYLMPGNW